MGRGVSVLAKTPVEKVGVYMWANMSLIIRVPLPASRSASAAGIVHMQWTSVWHGNRVWPCMPYTFPQALVACL